MKEHSLFGLHVKFAFNCKYGSITTSFSLVKSQSFRRILVLYIHTVRTLVVNASADTRLYRDRALKDTVQEISCRVISYGMKSYLFCVRFSNVHAALDLPYHIDNWRP